MEPTLKAWNKNSLGNEFEALEYFIKKLPFLGLQEDVKIILKPHPSDYPDKYLPWTNSLKKHQVNVDEDSTLEELISWADIVIGCETYAMVIALTACKKVYQSR